MNITAYFAQLGTPKTGLSPTINIRDISDGSLTVSAAAMTEVGDGFYMYAFTAYDPTKDYSIRCDGGATLIDADRYVIAATGIPADGSGFTALGDTRIANLDAAVSGRAPAGEYDTEMSRIDVDVSSRSTLTAAGVWDALLTGITTAASVGKLIKDYLDAAVSGRAPASEYDTEMARIDVAVSTRTKPADTQAKVTLVDTVTENTDMRGTDDGALATVCTEARLAELDAANLPADADSIKAVTDKVDNMIEAVE